MSCVLLSCCIYNGKDYRDWIHSIRNIKGVILLQDFELSGIKVSNHEVIVCNFEKGIIALYNIIAKSLMTLVSDETRYSYPMAFLPKYNAFIYSSSKRGDRFHCEDVKFAAMNIRTGTILFQYSSPSTYIQRCFNPCVCADGDIFMVDCSLFMEFYKVDFENKTVQEIYHYEPWGEAEAYDKEKNILLVYESDRIEQYTINDEGMERIHKLKLKWSEDIFDVDIISNNQALFFGKGRMGMLHPYQGNIIKEMKVPHDHILIHSIYKNNVFLAEKNILYRTDFDFQYLEKAKVFQEVNKIEDMEVLEFYPEREKMKQIRTCKKLTDIVLILSR